MANPSPSPQVEARLRKILGKLFKEQGKAVKEGLSHTSPDGFYDPGAILTTEDWDKRVVEATGAVLLSVWKLGGDRGLQNIRRMPKLTRNMKWIPPELVAGSEKVEWKGEGAGHPFRGNQYTNGQEAPFIWQSGGPADDDMFEDNARKMGSKIRTETLNGGFERDYIDLKRPVLLYHATEPNAEASIRKEGLRISVAKDEDGRLLQASGVYLGSKEGMRTWHGERTVVVPVLLPAGTRLYQDLQSNALFVTKPIPSDWIREKSVKGGSGSGNFGHSGRPGEVGGSDGDGSASDQIWKSAFSGQGSGIGDEPFWGEETLASLSGEERKQFIRHRDALLAWFGSSNRMRAAESKGTDDPKLADQVKAINEIVEKAPVYQGMMKRMLYGSPDIAVGSIYKTEALTSFAKPEGSFFIGETLLLVKNGKAFDISGASQSVGELEVVIKKGTSFEILSDKILPLRDLGIKRWEHAPEEETIRVLEMKQLDISTKAAPKFEHPTDNIMIGDWIDDPKVVKAAQKEMYRFAHQINQTSADELRDIIASGLENGDTITSIANGISNICEEWAEGWRAEMIARTETTRAYTQGHIEAWRQTGIVRRKVWSAAGDACPFCQELDGTVKDLDEPFLKLGESISTKWNGQEILFEATYEDVMGPPLHPNCRCAIVAEADFESEDLHPGESIGDLLSEILSGDISKDLAFMNDQVFKGEEKDLVFKGEDDGHPFRGNQYTDGESDFREAVFHPGPDKENPGKGGKWTTTDGKPLPPHISGIPPAWTNVKVNFNPNGDKLVQGTDSKGRAQGRYSAAHAQAAADAKFARIRESLDKADVIKRQNKRNMADPELKDTASCMALILDTGLRPGSDRDRQADKWAYGATTLLGKHVKQDPKGTVRLIFQAKDGVKQNIAIRDHSVASMMLDRAKNAGSKGRIFNTTDGKLLKYSHTLDGGGFKVKDFRTTVGTGTAIKEISKYSIPKTEKEYKKQVLAVADAVAKQLGNTRGMALQAYIDPHVFSAWRQEGWSLGKKKKSAGKPIDWRKSRYLRDEVDPDDELLDMTPEDVVLILGFDPLEEEEMETAQKGEESGHPFRGNQYTDGESGEAAWSWKGSRHIDNSPGDRFWETLTQTERDLIQNWYVAGTDSINPNLRNGWEIAGGAKKAMELLDQCFEEAPPLQEDLVVYRVIDKEVASTWLSLAVLEDKAFVSTSSSMEAIETMSDDKTTSIEIRIPAGKRVLPLNGEWNEHFFWQEEHLLPRGTRFRNMGNGKLEVI